MTTGERGPSRLVWLAVEERDLGRCQRCGGRGTEVHHRRGKSVKGVHRDCPCNLILLCGRGNHTGCHGWAHSNPEDARGSGLIVSRYVLEPASIPLNTWNGEVVIRCNGTVSWL